MSYMKQWKSSRTSFLNCLRHLPMKWWTCRSDSWANVVWMKIYSGTLITHHYYPHHRPLRTPTHTRTHTESEKELDNNLFIETLQCVFVSISNIVKINTHLTRTSLLLLSSMSACRCSIRQGCILSCREQENCFFPQFYVKRVISGRSSISNYKRRIMHIQKQTETQINRGRCQIC